MNEPELSPNARQVLEARYLLRDEGGQVIESPGALFERVARFVAQAEKRSRVQWAERFLDLMLRRKFIPNSPTLMNAGKRGGQLSACFVIPIEDRLEGIFDSLKAAATIHQSGGGTGFSFSRLRPKGSRVRSTQGVASGPVSFLRVFDVSTETIKQGGARRGANMAVLRVDHPDILEFVDSKRDLRSVTNFNISVGVTDQFMNAVREDGMFELVDPTGRGEAQAVRAKAIFDRIVQAAWECGDPGLVFLDRINLLNPTPLVGPMESTNPCGEQPLLPFESCNLGSLNLGEYVGNGAVAWERLGTDIDLAVRFLDDVIDVNAYPLRECEAITRGNRKIGLGIMGFSDLLLDLGIPYDSDEARVLGERVMSFVDRRAKAASCHLATEKGRFPNWKGSLWERLGFPPLRNATVSTVAPTGTISMIAGASSGIEPLFSGVFYRNILSGARLVDVHPAVRRAFGESGVNYENLTDEEIARVVGQGWSPARGVTIEGHVRMQAAFQRHSDSAVSKTINLPENATPADVRKAYVLAYSLGCKGITVYRDRSRPTQVLEAACPSC